MLHHGPALHHRLPGRAHGAGHLRSRLAAARLVRRPAGATVDELIAYFLALKGRTGRKPNSADASTLMALQRNLKALGTFGYQTTAAAIRSTSSTFRERCATSATTSSTCPASVGCGSLLAAHVEEFSVGSSGRETGGLLRRSTSQRASLGRGPRVVIEVHQGPAEPPRSMRFGISTHLYHDRRLERAHLAQIAGAGFETIELFATRSHFDYRDGAASRTWRSG